MDREEALDRLPEGHARALRLQDRGLGRDAIAESLGIPISAVGPLLRTAEAKLARLLSDGLVEASSPPAEPREIE